MKYIYKILSLILLINLSYHQTSNQSLPLPNYATFEGQDFIFYWNFNDTDKSVDIQMNFKQNYGYLCIGFGRNMMNVDMITLYQSNGQVFIDDYYSQGNDIPKTDKQLGTTNDIRNFQYNISNGMIYARFNRLLDTRDKYDAVIVPSSRYLMSYAVGGRGNGLYEHSWYKVVYFNFQNGVGQSNFEFLSEQYQNFANAHKIIMIIAWMFFTDVSIVFAHYLKTWKHYILVHSVLFLFVDLSTIITSIGLLALGPLDLQFNQGPTVNLYRAHIVIGVIMLALVVFQHAMGVYVKHTMESKTFPSQYFNVKNTHKYLGFLLYVLGKIQILIARDMTLENVFVPQGIFIIILFVIRVLIELYSRYRQNKLKRQLEYQEFDNIEASQTMNNILKELNGGESCLSIVKKYPAQRWCLYQDNVYDLSNLLHPGGNFIYEAVKGREVGRFLYGSYGLESLIMKSHLHSPSAFKQLLTHKVGRFNRNDINQGLLVNKNNQHLQQGEDIQFKQVDLDFGKNQKWTLVKKTDLSKNIGAFYFQNQNTLLQNKMAGVQWIGKYYELTVNLDKNEQKTRLYTNVSYMTNENQQIKQNYINYYNAIKQQNNEGIAQCEKYFNSLQGPICSETLPLVIKKYDFQKTLSANIHQSPLNLVYNIKGPYGVGLDLLNIQHGTICLFAGGTGLLPFMDFLFYWMRRSTVQALTKINKEKAKIANFYNDDFDENLQTDAKLVLFVSCIDFDEFNAMSQNIIEQLYQINRESNLNNFELKLRIQNGQNQNNNNLPLTNQYFDAAFIQSNLRVDENLKRVYICGPPSFNKTIPEVLSKIGVSEEKVQLM